MSVHGHTSKSEKPHRTASTLQCLRNLQLHKSKGQGPRMLINVPKLLQRKHKNCMISDASFIHKLVCYYFLLVGMSLRAARTRRLTAPMPVQAAHCTGVSGTV